MIIKYEIACREAGLSEENTAEIRKFLDAEQKKLKRRKEAKKKTQKDQCMSQIDLAPNKNQMKQMMSMKKK